MATSGVVLSPVKEDSFFSPQSLCHGSRQCHGYVSDGIQIYLSTENSYIPLRVLASDTIASVKMKIQAYKGFYVKQQKLVYGGRELSRSNSLIKDYGVTDGNVLHLVLRLSDLQVVTVKTVDGKELVFQLERNRNIGELKQRIAQREKGLGLEEQELVFKGKQLEDQRLVDDLTLENDAAVVHLFVRKSAKVRTKPIGKDVELSVATSDEPGIKQYEIQRDHAVQEKSSMQVAVRPSMPLPLSEKHNSYDDDGIQYQRIDTGCPTSRCVLEPLTASPRHKLSATFNKMIKDMREGLECGYSPIQSKEGSGGAYFMQDSTGMKYIGVFKPIDEEPMAINNPRGLPISLNGEGLKKGTRVGEGAYREVAAYILDHPIDGPRSLVGDEVGFAGVPPTMMIKCSHAAFHVSAGFGKFCQEPKVGSLQKFVESYSNCEDMGPAAFPVEEVHRITVLDMRLANADRHGGNILVCKREDQSSIQLIPIDHGYCLPENTKISMSYRRAFFDGAAQRGSCVCGVFISMNEDLHLYIYWNGGDSSNNKGEAIALAGLLQCSTFLNIQMLQIYGDSKIIIEQGSGKLSNNNPMLFGWMNMIKMLWNSKPGYSINHVDRSLSSRADDLSKKGLAIQPGSWKMEVQMQATTYQIEDFSLRGT